MPTITRIVPTKPATPAPASTTGAAAAVASVRNQAACVRMLLDELERLVPSGESYEGVNQQLVEELARLGCRTLEAAEALLRVVEEPRRCA